MSLIGRFEHLPGRPKSNEARPLLEKIASQVKPIMAKRDWKVGTLAEFLPADPSLLGNNMNAGQRINLRLRPPGAESTFYEYDQLVLVMLHELTHIVHGPHDSQFYKLLAELEEEFYSLKRKGYEGEGFHGRGNHLQGLKVSEYEGRKKGLLAAQKRLDTQVRIGKGGTLGGTVAVRGKTMREILAEAAERRVRDDKACHPEGGGGGHNIEVQREVEKAQRESVGIDAVDLTGSDSDGDVEVITPPPVASVETAKQKSSTVTADEVVMGPHNAIRSPLVPSISSNTLPASSVSEESPTAPLMAPTDQADPSKRTRPTPAEHNNAKSQYPVPRRSEWSCPTCTLLNPSASKQCEACSTPRPVDRDKARRDGQWMCEFCASGPISMDRWSCTECGWVRNWG